MPKRQQRSPEISALIEAILLAGKQSIPPMNAGVLASRVGISPETLSRMKSRGSGDIAVISNLAELVGLRLTLSTNEDTKNKILSGGFFDD